MSVLYSSRGADDNAAAEAGPRDGRRTGSTQTV